MSSRRRCCGSNCPTSTRWNAQRRGVAAQYHKIFGDQASLVLPEIVEGHIFHQFTIRVQDGRRDQLQAALAEAGVQTMIYYPVPVHRLKIYQESHRVTSCPVAERAAKEVLSLPIWPEFDPTSTLAHIIRAGIFL